MISIRPGVRFVSNEDGGILLNIDSDSFFGLNPTASFIFRLVREGLSEQEIGDALVKETKADQSVVYEDLRLFLLQLSNHKLIVMPSEEPDTPRSRK